jgi:hypothetical protein
VNKDLPVSDSLPEIFEIKVVVTEVARVGFETAHYFLACFFDFEDA